jgi:hypothetical protein
MAENPASGFARGAPHNPAENLEEDGVENHEAINKMEARVEK